MANFIVDPNTGIKIPTPGLDGGINNAPTGTDYATLISIALTTLSAIGHTGAPTDGNQIVTGAININDDLTFNNFNATNLNTIRFINNSGSLSTSSDKNEAYVVSGDLWY